jgi:hypothetical protein
MTLFAPAITRLRGPKAALTAPTPVVAPIKRQVVNTIQEIEAEASVAIRAYLLMRHDPQGIYAAEPTNMLKALMPFDHEIVAQRLEDHLLNKFMGRAGVKKFFEELQPLMRSEGMSILGLLANNSMEHRISLMSQFEDDDSMIVNGTKVTISAMLASVWHLFEFLENVDSGNYDERIYGIYATSVFADVDIIDVIRLVLRYAS